MPESSEENMTHDLNGELRIPSSMLGIANIRIIETYVDRDDRLIVHVKSNEIGT